VLNERVNARVNAGGRYSISSTRLRGVFPLRICVLGFRTAEGDVERVARTVAEAAAAELAAREREGGRACTRPVTERRRAASCIGRGIVAPAPVTSIPIPLLTLGRRRT
jgi:hypothetical protein